VLTGTELARCIELVMGDGARAVAIRERAKALKETAQAAMQAGLPRETFGTSSKQCQNQYN